MGAYVLIGGLWAAVLGYWLWSRRPTTADTVGVFRRELRVLRTATPVRVAPANRLDARRPVLGASAGAAEGYSANPLAAAAANHKRMEMRRRRRDILGALGAGAAMTMLLAAVTGSALVIALQVVCDLALAGYVALLLRTVAARPTYAPARRRAPAPVPVAAARASEGAGGARYDDTDYFASAVLTGVDRPPLAARIARRTAVARSAATSVPAAGRASGRHAAQASARQVDYDLTEYEQDGAASHYAGATGAYGDFEDYEALALAN